MLLYIYLKNFICFMCHFDQAYTGIFLESYNPDNASDNLLGNMKQKFISEILICVRFALANCWLWLKFAIDPNRKLGVYLEGVANATDAQAYVKENPIGVPSISSDHPDWNFYSEVLQGIKDQREESIASQQQNS